MPNILANIHSVIVKEFNEFKLEAKEGGNYVPTFQEFKDWKKKQLFIANVSDDKHFLIKSGKQITISHDDWERGAVVENLQDIIITAPRFKRVALCICCPNFTLILDWGNNLQLHANYEDVGIEDSGEYRTTTLQ